MSTEKIVSRLRHIGFYATAFDLEDGRIDAAGVAFRLRRDAPKRTDHDECIALATEIEEATS